MNLIEAVILGVLQGITEFLPISSSGHLVLGQQLMGLEVEVLKNFDVVVHIGSLFAVFAYFRKDVYGMLKAIFNLFKGVVDTDDPYGKLIVYIIIGTIPVAVVGALWEEQIDLQFRSAEGVAIVMIVTGLVFIFGEFVYKYVHGLSSVKNRFSEKLAGFLDWIKPGGFESKGPTGLSLFNAVFIGFAQAVALIPGVSRSGTTIVAGLFRGIKRDMAARFSFLLAMPAIAGAGVLTVIKNGDELFAPSVGAPLPALITGFFVSFVFSFLCIWFLMHFFKRFSLNVFAVYLIVLGVWIFV